MSIVERLCDQSLVIQYPERKQIAGLIEQQVERIKKLETELECERMRLAACGTAVLGYFDGCKDEYRSASLDDVLRLREQLSALRKRIDDAPVVAWEYSLCDDAGVIARQASKVNWDERYQPYGRPGIDYSAKARVTKKALISKEDLK